MQALLKVLAPWMLLEVLVALAPPLLESLKVLMALAPLEEEGVGTA